MGKRQRTTFLDEQLDDVARQNEDEADQDDQVRRRQRVEDELGEKVWRQRRGAAGQGEQADECGNENRDTNQDQLRVVAERTARRRRSALRRAWGRCGM